MSITNFRLLLVSGAIDCGRLCLLILRLFHMILVCLVGLHALLVLHGLLIS